MHITNNKVNTLKRCVSDCEKAVITHVLLKTRGDKSQAAELLGIKESLLAEKIRHYEIHYAHK